MANLNRILQLLDERNIAREVSMYHDMGRETYTIQNHMPATFDEMIKEASRFYQEQYQITMGGNELIPEWMSSGFVTSIIEKTFSKFGGLEGAFVIASTGVAGGMKAIIDSIYEYLKREQEEQYVLWVLTESECVDVTSWDDKVALMQQYLDRFHVNMPAGTRIKSAEQLVAGGYKEFVKLHMDAVRNIRTRMTS